MMFLLSEDIVQKYRPRKDVHAISAMDESVKCRMDFWEPCEEITIEALDDILVRLFCMKKVIIAKETKESLSANLEHEGITQQYICSYMFENTDAWKRWAMSDEIELSDFLQEIREGNIAKLENEKKNEINQAKIQELEYRLEQECASYRVERYKLIHVLSEDGNHFHGMRSEGAIPRIIRFSLFHLSGKAPIPEETYSEWYLYLQFLMEIGYI